MNSKLTSYKDEAGLIIREMSFDMQKLGQFGLWVKAVSEQVSKNTDDIEELKQEIKQLRRENKEIRTKLAIKDAKEVTPIIYEF